MPPVELPYLILLCHVLNNPLSFRDPSGYSTDKYDDLLIVYPDDYGGGNACDGGNCTWAPGGASGVLTYYGEDRDFSNGSRSLAGAGVTFSQAPYESWAYTAAYEGRRGGSGGSSSDKRPDAQKGYTKQQKASIGALIQNSGQSSGLLDSDFEIGLFQRWWNGNGSNLEIDQARFQLKFRSSN